MFKRARTYNRKADWEESKLLRKEINQELSDAFSEYINGILDPEENKPGACKKFYSFIKSLKQDNFGVGTLKKGGRVGATSKDKADMCNAQTQPRLPRLLEMNSPRCPKSGSMRRVF